MNKLLLLLTLSITASATQYYEPIQEKYCSFPEAPDLDQEAYNKLAHIIAAVHTSLLNNNTCRLHRMEVIRDYLLKLGTPEALRLWSDLQQQWE